MNNDLPIEKLLKNLPTFKVDPVLNSQILKALENRRVEQEVSRSIRMSHRSFNLLTLFTMNAKKCVAVMAAMVLVLFGTFSYQNNSYAYHLSKARTALGELQAVLAGQAPVSFVPRAWAGGVAVDEIAVTQLTTTVVDETEAAIEIVEETSDAHLLETALEEVHAVQEESLGVLGEAVQVVENPEAVVTVVAAIETVAQQQEEVQESLEVVEVAIAQAPEEPVTVEVTTTMDVEAALEAEAVAAEEPAPETPSEPTVEDEKDEEGGAFRKVEVCHVRGQGRLTPHTLTVAGPAIRAHLNHGDTLGPCAAPSEEAVSAEEQQASLVQWKKQSHEKALEAKFQSMMERKERAEQKIEALEEFAKDVKELAESQGVEVSAEPFTRHEALLQEARKAYEAGDQKLARALVDESKGLFKKLEGLEEVTETVKKTHQKEWFEKRAEAEREQEASERLDVKQKVESQKDEAQEEVQEKVTVESEARAKQERFSPQEQREEWMKKKEPSNEPVKAKLPEKDFEEKRSEKSEKNEKEEEMKKQEYLQYRQEEEPRERMEQKEQEKRRGSEEPKKEPNASNETQEKMMKKPESYNQEWDQAKWEEFKKGYSEEGQRPEGGN